MLVTTAYLNVLEEKAEISAKRSTWPKIIQPKAKNNKIETKIITENQ